MTVVNIASHLKRMATAQPDQWAVRIPNRSSGHDPAAYTSYTYRSLDEQSDHLAAGLDRMGVGRGVRTVLMVPPSLEFFLLTFALFKAGAVPVLVDPGMGIRNLGKCLAEAEPAAFIGITRAHVARALFGWARNSIKALVTVGPRLWWRGPNLASLLATGRQRQTGSWSAKWDAAATQADDTAAILFTSGSTGVPKGAVYSHGNFAAQVEALKQAFQIEPGEVDLCTFPLFALFAPALGMTAIVPRMDFTRPANVEPGEIDWPIRQFGINNLFGSPALLNRIGRKLASANVHANGGAPLTENAETRWPTIRRVLSAGAPVSAAVIERFSKLIPRDAQVFTPYGATESLPVAVIGSHEILRETRQATAEGAGTCVGRPVTGVDVRIIKITDEPIAEWNDNLCLPDGEIGEIVVAGPMVTQAYYKRHDLTALAKIRDPLSGRMRHRMGDTGYFDRTGRLWFCGRKSHRVVARERTYFTEPVEGIFNSHEAVFRSALVGVKRGHDVEPVLCVERERRDSTTRARQLTNDQLKAELLEIGARFDLTKLIRTILYHDKFPVDIRHNSKIFREKLAVWAAERMKSGAGG